MPIPSPSRFLCQNHALDFRRAFSSVTLEFSHLHRYNAPRRRSIHAASSLLLPRKRDFFSSNSVLQQQVHRTNDVSLENQQPQKKRQLRLPVTKPSLRRVAVEAQRSKDGGLSRIGAALDIHSRTKMVTAYCAAEQFNISKVISILEGEGYEIDPYRTGLLPQVVHIQIPVPPSDGVIGTETQQAGPVEFGDVFIFPSGTVVAWSVPENLAFRLVTKILLPAAENAHLEHLETEDLEYLEDPSRENSFIKSDIIFLGTGMQEPRVEVEIDENARGLSQSSDLGYHSNITERGAVDTVLTKIAFSSGLARSTKLAVLESLLSNYFGSTRSIPTLLSRGSRLPFTRSFILRKTGQLLSVRAQLNLYSELTDSLPDLFWDSRHELGLEGYYDQVGRALDVGVRIKTLNEKMDYAQEIASVLRERLSEKHGLVLEWMIIALIAVEVGFEILRLWKEKERDGHSTSEGKKD